MSDITTPENKRLRIWQQNLAKSKRAQYNLVNSNSLPKLWDIIIIQEPFFDTHGNTKASAAWKVVYPSDTLTSDARVRSIILVNTLLDTNTWSQLSIVRVQHGDTAGTIWTYRTRTCEYRTCE